MMKFIKSLFGQNAQHPSTTSVATTTWVHGTVGWFSAGQGFGFIVVPGETEPYYAHQSQVLLEGGCLRQGQRVMFEPAQGTVGRRAKQIQLQRS